MRILSAAILAAFFTAGTVSAYAQGAAPAAPAAKAKTCSKRTEAACTAPDCSWTAPTGKQKTGKCSKAKK
jgi:hypothetical protein